MNRWQALDPNGNVLALGSRMMDVEGMGPRYLIDYKKTRYAFCKLYPLTRYNWFPLDMLGRAIRFQIPGNGA